MKLSILVPILITVSIITLLVYGFYINFMIVVPNFNTFVFTVLVFVLFGVTLYLMRKHYGNS